MSRREDAFQIALVGILEWNGVYVRHVKNQGKWSPQYGAKLNRMGRKKGAADLECFTEITPQLSRGIFMIDAKRPPRVLKSGRLSTAKPKLDEDQQEVADLLMARFGIPTLCVNTLDEAIVQIKALGVPLNGRAM